MSGEDIVVALCGIIEEQAAIIRSLIERLAEFEAIDKAEKEAARRT